MIPLGTLFKALSVNPFSPLRQLYSVCPQQAWCCVHLPMIKEAKIQPMAPVSEPPVNQVSFPPLSVLFPATDGMEENTTCAPDPSTSALKSPLMALGLLSAILSLPTCITKRGVTVRGPHQTREFPSNIPDPGPREAADFPWDGSWRQIGPSVPLRRESPVTVTLLFFLS